jgi:hypothetical protein
MTWWQVVAIFVACRALEFAGKSALDWWLDRPMRRAFNQALDRIIAEDRARREAAAPPQR